MKWYRENWSVDRDRLDLEYSWLLPNDALDPVDVRIDPCVNAWQTGFGTSNAERCDANDGVHARNWRMRDLNRTARVTLTRIPMPIGASTKLGLVDHAPTQISTQMRCIRCIALRLADYIQSSLLQNIAGRFGVLGSTPAGGRHLLGADVKRFGQTSRSHVLTERNGMLQFQQCDVVVFGRYSVVIVTYALDNLHIDGLCIVSSRHNI